MKKFLLLATLTGFCFLGRAQDFKKVQNNVLLGQLENAKTELDKYASDAKAQAKPEYWMWKSKIYAGFFKDEKLRSKYQGSEAIANEAFKKYASLDTSFAILKANNGQETAFNVYSTAFNLGIKTFNMKKWDSSYYYFSLAVEYSDVIFHNKWSSSAMAFDTTSILYAGYSAQNGKNLDNACKFYSRLVDNKVASPNYIDIYRFILVENSDKKDSGNFYKYYGLSQQAYPNENWYEYELDFINKYYSLSGKTALYDAQDKAGTLNANKYLHFGDIFYNLSKQDKEGLDSAGLAFYQSKGRDAFKKSYLLDTTNAIAAFNAGVIYYNDYNVLDDRLRVLIKSLQEINSSKPVEKDPKKKAAIEAKFKEKTDPVKKAMADLDAPTKTAIDSSLIWLEKAYLNLKDKHPKANFEKSSYIKSIDFLANLYAYKRDKLRGKDPKGFDEYDAKFKFYDNLHDVVEKEKD